MLALLALQAVSEYSRLERKPPVTAALVAANSLVYLRIPASLDALLPTLDQVWFNPHLIVKYKDFKRLFLSAFYHIGESHLVYNMLSLLWKGIQLETLMGSVEFASMVAVLVVLSQGITLALAKSLLMFFDYERPYYKEYSVGFSGVLFAMKVILNSYSENFTYVHGFIVPSRYAAWAELFLIQMFVPGVSFLGHLGGILAGLLYLRLKAWFSGPDLLTEVVRGIFNVVSRPFSYVSWLFGFPRRRIRGRGTVGGRQRSSGANVWTCRRCTYDNSGWLNFCEMCGSSHDGEEVLPPFGFSVGSHDLPLEELRRRRVERFRQ